jgi:hypothetical protein
MVLGEIRLGHGNGLFGPPVKSYRFRPTQVCLDRLVEVARDG